MTIQRRQAIRDGVALFRDSLGMPMDDGIIDLVAALRYIGFSTVSSCAGHADRWTHGPYVMMVSERAHDLEKVFSDMPHDDQNRKPLTQKAVRIRNSEMQRLFDALKMFYETREAVYETMIIIRSIGWSHFRIEPNGIQLFDGEDGGRHAEYLIRWQHEMDEFQAFLIERYP